MSQPICKSKEGDYLVLDWLAKKWHSLLRQGGVVFIILFILFSKSAIAENHLSHFSICEGDYRNPCGVASVLNQPSSSPPQSTSEPSNGESRQENETLRIGVQEIKEFNETEEHKIIGGAMGAIGALIICAYFLVYGKE